MHDYEEYDATALAGLVKVGQVSPAELLDAALTRVEALNPEINAVVLPQIETARRLIAQGLPDGALHGVPFLLKDLGAEATDFPGHNGSRLSRDGWYDGDSALYDRLAAGGVVTFGRTTAPEGGCGPATEAAVYGGPTRNPWNLDRTPGGSSGGAGAAVSAGIVPIAHGSDGGGSVRIPASNCGLFGFKATRARLPDGPYAGEGWAGMAIDGFLTRSVRDTAALLDLCAGPDLGAPYHAPPLSKGYRAALADNPESLKVALCTTRFDGRAIHPECADGVKRAGALLESLGHHVEEARPSEADHIGMMQAWTKIVACGTALSVRSDLKELGRELRPDDIEPIARSAMAYAQTISGADYLAAVGKVHAYGRQMAGFFEDYDLLVSSTMAEPPAEIGRFDHSGNDYVHYRMGPGMAFDYSPFCSPFNASGQPAASVPLHWSDDNLPIGIQIAAQFGADEVLIALCARLEEAQPWFHRRPPLTLAPKSLAKGR